jgi:hypothetical protein
MTEFDAPFWWNSPEPHENPDIAASSTNPSADTNPVILPGDIVYHGGPEYDAPDTDEIVYVGGAAPTHEAKPGDPDVNPESAHTESGGDPELASLIEEGASQDLPGGYKPDETTANDAVPETTDDATETADHIDMELAALLAGAQEIKQPDRGFDVSTFDERPPTDEAALDAANVHKETVGEILDQHKELIDPVGQALGVDRVYLQHDDPSGRLHATVSSDGTVVTDYQDRKGGLSHGAYIQEDVKVVLDSADPRVAVETLPPPGRLPYKVAEEARARLVDTYNEQHAQEQRVDRDIGLNFTTVGPEHMGYIANALRHAVPKEVPFETIDGISRSRVTATDRPSAEDARDAGRLLNPRLYEYLKENGYNPTTADPIERQVGDITGDTLTIEAGERAVKTQRYPYVQLRLLNRIDPSRVWDRLKEDYGKDLEISDESCWEETILDYAAPAGRLLHTRHTHLYEPGFGFSSVGDNKVDSMYGDRLEVGRLTYFLRSPTIWLPRADTANRRR